MHAWRNHQPRDADVTASTLGTASNLATADVAAWTLGDTATREGSVRSEAFRASGNMVLSQSCGSTGYKLTRRYESRENVGFGPLGAVPDSSEKTAKGGGIDALNQ